MWDSAGKINTYTLFSEASWLALNCGFNPSTRCFRLKCGRFVKSLLTSVWSLCSSEVVVIITLMTFIRLAAVTCRKRQNKYPPQRFCLQYQLGMSKGKNLHWECWGKRSETVLSQVVWSARSARPAAGSRAEQWLRRLCFSFCLLALSITFIFQLRV